jgi:hypothetical protein
MSFVGTYEPWKSDEKRGWLVDVMEAMGELISMLRMSL